MVTAHYSNKQGYKSRQTSCRSHRPRTSETCRHQDDVFGYEVQFLRYELLPVFRNMNYNAKQVCLMCCPFNKVIKRDSNSFYSYRRITRRKVSSSTLYKQWHRPISKWFIRQSYSISRVSLIDSNCCRLHKASILSKKADNSRSS